MTWLEKISHSAVILGIPIFLTQLWIDQGRGRTTHTIEYAQQIIDGDLSESTFALFAPWQKYDVDKFLSADPTPEQIEELVSKVVEDNPQVTKSLYKMSLYFNGLTTCLDARACDEWTAEKTVAPIARQIRSLYLSEIKKMESTHGLENFSFVFEKATAPCWSKRCRFKRWLRG